MTAGPGAVVGAMAGCGVVLVVGFVRARRRPTLEQRVAPYVGRVRAGPGTGDGDGLGATGAALGLLMPTVRGAADRLDRVLGGSASVSARLERSGDVRSLAQFRLEQLVWGTAAFAGALVLLLGMLAGGDSGLSAPAALVVCVAAGASGVLVREQVLNRAVARRSDRIEAEFPAVAELLALAVAAGEGAAGAVARVARVCSGALAVELNRVLDDTRTGAGLAEALAGLGERVGVPAVRRFVDGVVIAVERGTPLADVLRAQAVDARELRRRRLMESAGRREIAMLVPVVFLILPVTVLFALFPGFYGLSLSAP